MSAAKILWGQVLAVFLIILTSVWAATQWTASALGFQPELGTPWFSLFGHPVYRPYDLFWWWFSYDAYAPQIFDKGGMIATSGGFVAIMVAIAMSVWRGRETNNTKTYGSAQRHRVLMMLDEFPALGRLDFFESALAFMAGYGLKSFLIAQSLNQIERAYGKNNAILDNCHVRVAFATNDEGTAKRVSESLGTATEQRSMRNYAGHRLSPWLGHLMISRSETSRPLLTQGEILQLPDTDEIVMLSGSPPIKAKKARYYADPRLQARILPPPEPLTAKTDNPKSDDWSALPTIKPLPKNKRKAATHDDAANSGIRREPEIPAHVDVQPQKENGRSAEFDFGDHPDQTDNAVRAERLRIDMARSARQASLDPGDGIAL